MPGIAGSAAGTTVARPGPVPVLLYHSISDDPPGWIADYTVRPADFARHLDLVVSSGRRPVTLTELVEVRRLGVSDGNEVVITFDDGFADLLTEALPLLAERGLPSTAYLTTGCLRGGGPRRSWKPLLDAPMLQWADLPRLAEAGMELGAHSVTHPHLDGLPAAAIASELAISKAALETATASAVSSFAYPHGSHDKRCRRAVAESGFSSACAVRNALSPTGDDPFGIARLTVRAGTSLATVEAWLAARGATVSSQREHLRTAVWRTARRASGRRHLVESDTVASH